MKTQHCDQCIHFLFEEQVQQGSRWITHVGLCLLGHKPKFYKPKSTLDTGYGYKRKCSDFKSQSAVREHITDGSQCWCNPEMTYKDPDNGAEVWVHKEPQ
jgi:hypothetical protein